MSRSVLVIGAGVVGLCSAEALARRGFKVTVIDRDLGERGCSYGNGGLIVPSHFIPLASPGMVQKGLAMMVDPKSPFGFSRIPDWEVLSWMARFLRAANKKGVERASPLLLQLNRSSRVAYEELIGRMGVDVGYEQRGCLMLCKTEEAFREEVALAEKARTLGMKVRVLKKTDLMLVDAEMTMNVQGAVHFEEDAHLSPPLFMGALRSYLDASGVCLLQGEVSDFRRSGPRLESVRTSEGEMQADEFVISAGVWSRDLFRQLGLKLPLLSGRGYGFTVLDQDLPSKPWVPAILVEARIAVTPMPEGVRFVGALELGPPIDCIRESRLEGMRINIPEYYPTFHSALDPDLLTRPAVWSGHRPCTPDGLPYLGRPAAFENLTIATGHAMMGMSLGPVSGELVAQTIGGEPCSAPMDLLSPDRYG